MSITLAIALKDIKEAFRNKAIYIYIAVLLFISFPYLDGLRNILAQLVNEGSDTATLREASQSFLNIVMYTSPITLSIEIIFVSVYKSERSLILNLK